MRKPNFSSKEFGHLTADLEHWLRTEGVTRYDAFKDKPTGISAQQMFVQLRQHHAKRLKTNP
jgi:hypothetical protein